jgi:hypothetical protein
MFEKMSLFWFECLFFTGLLPHLDDWDNVIVTVVMSKKRKTTQTVAQIILN